MNKEMKRQLILSLTLLCLIVATLFLWYDNFMFHTYVHVADYQYCFNGNNNDFMVDGYEFYQHSHNQKHGGARIVALQNQLLLEGDEVMTVFEIVNKQGEEFDFKQQYTIKSDNEAFRLDEEETTQQLSQSDFVKTTLQIKIIRDDKDIYNENITMNANDIVVYNGSNKNYAISNVYVTKSWLKTGDFSSTIKGIDKKYSLITIDYLYLKDNGNETNIDDYERFAYINGSTKDIMNNSLYSSVFYDGEGSLLDKTLACVVTLSQDENTEDAYVFMLSLHGTIKVVEPHDS